MSICTFFGHRDLFADIDADLHKIILWLIQEKGVKTFYVGNHGAFDHLVAKKLQAIQEVYPHIQYNIVLAYLPGKKPEFSYRDYSNTIFPEEMQLAPPRYAIDRRNLWMLERAEYVVTYVMYHGGAAKYKEIAEKRGKWVFNLCDEKNKTTL